MMLRNTLKGTLTFLTTIIAAAMLGIPVFAAIPATGDGTKLVLPIMGGLLAISVVLGIVYAVLSAKKKK